jgi:hypothetical protein
MAKRTHLEQPLSAISRPVLGNDRTKRYGFLCEQDAKNNVAKLADFYPNHRWEVERVSQREALSLP